MENIKTLHKKWQKKQNKLQKKMYVIWYFDDGNFCEHENKNKTKNNDKINYYERYRKCKELFFISIKNE